jgi:hypothetical protein
MHAMPEMTAKLANRQQIQPEALINIAEFKIDTIPMKLLVEILVNSSGPK